MTPISRFTCTTNTSQMPIKCKFAIGHFFGTASRQLHCIALRMHLQHSFDSVVVTRFENIDADRQLQAGTAYYFSKFWTYEVPTTDIISILFLFLSGCLPHLIQRLNDLLKISVSEKKRRQEECTDEANLLFFFLLLNVISSKFLLENWIGWLIPFTVATGTTSKTMNNAYFPLNLVRKWNYSFFYKSKIVTIDDW